MKHSIMRKGSVISACCKHLRPWLFFLVAGILSVGASDALQKDVDPPAAEQVLREAFERRYGCDLSAHIEILVTNGSGERMERKLDLASKHINGRLHSLARFSEPQYLRGTGLLIIERVDVRSADEHFIFLPSLGRVRRISGARRGDAFLGTDLTFEDFERRRVEDYELAPIVGSSIEGEPVHVVEAQPRFSSSSTKVRFFVAKEDFAILRMEHFKRSGPPFKVIETPRRGIQTESKCRVPTFMTVHHPARGTRTEMRIARLTLNPDLPKGLFSTVALESGRIIPIQGAKGGE